ncbi:MAG: phosphoglucomutase [Treponema sp.]|nr:phosphoglucomutase [Treponema sp.]
MISIDDFILSASGWRKVFTVSGKEEDTYPKIGNTNTALVMLAAETFAEYICKKTGKTNPVVACGIDTRPTGPSIADAVIRVLTAYNVVVKYIGIVAAPEIMTFSTKLDGFVYISASHNPVGHNGLKFGLNDGGVLPGSENVQLIESFKQKCAQPDAEERITSVAKQCKPIDIDTIYMEALAVKKDAIATYKSFIMQVISACQTPESVNEFFNMLRAKAAQNKIGVVCDMNGSARTLSIDKAFFEECGISFYAINDTPGQIAHAIIPEPENLVHCAKEMERLHNEGKADIILGYMPDCDGDRGNIVYWDEIENKAKILKAQEVFSLSVLSELAFSQWIHRNNKNYKPAVVVNGPTSMRIDAIASFYNASVFRAEVGEANVVNLARQKRSEGYSVRILGEGSNGGNITHPEAVRDPINTIFSLIKLYVLRSDQADEPNLFHTWCQISGNTTEISDTFSFRNILKTVPRYVTTGVSDKRAIMHITTQDHTHLKKNFQIEFEKEWNLKKNNLQKKYDICSYTAITTNGTVEKKDIDDFSISGRGGLKIVFYDSKETPCAFMWMRGSGTEPVFRIMCDVKGLNPDMESDLIQWETSMLKTADSQ